MMDEKGRVNEETLAHAAHIQFLIDKAMES
jgi:hypothetical protein